MKGSLHWHWSWTTVGIRYETIINPVNFRYDDGSPLSTEDILEEANVFIFEGHDTTASGISWSLLILSQHPEHMAKCYEEIKEVFDNGSGDEYVTQQQINELTHFSLCIKECLRLRSPVPMIGRQLHKDVHIGE